MAEILKIESKQKSYLLNNDLLIAGIPYAKTAAAVAALKDGKTDPKSLCAVQVFTLDDTFSMEFNESAGQIILRQEKKCMVEDAAELDDIAAWLIRNLKSRHFRPHNERASEPKNLRFSFISALIIALLTGLFAYLKHTGVLPALGADFPLISSIEPLYNPGGIIIIGAIMVILIQIIILAGNLHRHHYKTVYRKNTTSSRLSVNRSDLVTAQAATSRQLRKQDGHYAFATKIH